MAKISVRRKSMLDYPEEVLTLARSWLEKAKGQWKWLVLGLVLIGVGLAAWFLHAQIRDHREAAAAVALARVRPQLAAPQAGAAAVKALEQVVQDNSGTNGARDAQLLRANLLYQQKNYAAAAKAYESLLPSGDPAWDVLINESLSYCYEGLGDYKKAAAALKTVQEQTSGPLKGEVLQRLALFLEKSGNYQEAAVYWKKLLDQGGNPSLMPYLKEKLAAAKARSKK
jgi:predicted negative regulator of RcsB-dependent stress response